MAVILDGAKVAKEIRSDLERRIAQLRERGVTPQLAFVLVGDDPASVAYLYQLSRRCGSLSMQGLFYRYPDHDSQERVAARIQALNADGATHGILLPLPLPPSYDGLVSQIDPRKDADGITPFHRGRLLAGEGAVVSCAPQAVLRLLDEYHLGVNGQKVVVVGNGYTVGEPLGVLLRRRGALVTVHDSKTGDSAAETREADFLICAVGKPEYITGEMVKPGAVVVDAGISNQNRRIVGDVDVASVVLVASYISPVPGGVGPVTEACLLERVVRFAELQQQGSK